MNRIKNVFMVLICLVFVLLYSYSFIYADTKAESPDTGISGILQNGSEWFKSAKDKGVGDSNMGGIISDILGTKGSGGLLDAIFQIGNVVFIIVTIILGLKYMFSSIEGKVEVKESLITLGIGAIFFYLPQTLFNFFKDLFGGFSETTTINAVTDKIFSIVASFANIGAIIAIVAIGLKYMMTNSEEKAELKEKFIPIIIGLAMVYASAQVLNFFVSIGSQIF